LSDRSQLVRAEIAVIVTKVGVKAADHGSAARSADRDEVCGARIDAGALAELGDLVDESHDQMGPERLGEPA
jgi:hypothetical protein